MKPPLRHKQKHNFIYGTRAILEAIRAGKTIDKVFIDRAAKGPIHRELIILMQQYQVPYSRVPTAKLNRLASQNHQGAIALLAPIALASLGHIIQVSYEQGKMPLVVILDSITDVRNLGAIVRTAVCVGASALVIPTQGSASIGGDAMKTSAGALAYLPICRVASLQATISYLQESGLQVMACHDKAAESLYTTDLNVPIAILLGAEDKGIRSELLQRADKHVCIPMVGPVASLNVSVAAAVILYESFRQRQS
ncbi:MAG: 23S rRNA (guanosine(2251)-2'-O)-methyltransferase RlmB [Bacteroidota bacterium]